MACRSAWFMPAVLVLVGAPIMALTSACSEQARHDVLAVIFDGVPPYVSPEDRVRLLAEAEEQAVEEAAQAESERVRRGRQVAKISRFTHGPFAAKECGSCHDLAAASGFRSAGANLPLMPGAGGELAEAGRLRMPVDKLCIRCHSDFAPSAPENAGLWMHGPVHVGWCVTCHQAHSSSYEHLVHAEPSARLCTQCHIRGDLLAFTPEHRPSELDTTYPASVPTQEQTDGDAGEDPARPADAQVIADCTRCHDPHRGVNRFILKAARESESSSSVQHVVRKIAKATLKP